MRYLVFLCFSILAVFVLSADDLLITRSGTEYHGKLELLSDKEVTFKIKGSGFIGLGSSPRTFPTDDIYMIKSEKRGYTFFNRSRERVILPLQSIEKKANLIYLVDGGEIPAWNISLKDGMIKYQKTSKPLLVVSTPEVIPVKNVFMIKYHDGSKDIITDITGSFESGPASSSSKERKLKVIFYQVLNGDSIESIAGKYDVSVDDLREWNDFPLSIKNTTQLTAGQQIMIQVETD